MNDSPQTLNYVSQSFFRSLSGNLTDAEFAKLEDILIHDVTARRHYYDLVYVSTVLKNSEGILGLEELLSFDTNFWVEMAEYEKTAPGVEIPKEGPKREVIQKVVYSPREKRKMNKFGIFVLAVNAAAVLFFVLFLKFAPSKRGIEVATLTDSINAQWADINAPMEKGTRITTGNERLLLRQGYAELLFDTDARVVIEAPAEFQILAGDRIGLAYGKAYATVPKEAIGFSIYTQNAKIIDLGTEFGVLAELGGNTQLHVLKGKTILMAGENRKVNMEVSGGTAKEVSNVTGEISDIVCQSDYFVRTIISESNCIWRGQDILDLADIVGGGNGFGTGKVNMGFDPISGKPSGEVPGTRGSGNDYHLVSANSYIDGVFVPNGLTRQIISSEGHLFIECPVTSGLCCQNITNMERILDELATEDMKVSDSPAHCLLLHSNMGITFDLQAMRRLLPGVEIARFQSKFGIRGGMRPSASNADFWILVDGKVRYKKDQVKIGELYSVDLELSEKDRFLTLVETDGGDPEGRVLEGLVLNPIDSDWGMFADPVLMLE